MTEPANHKKTCLLFHHPGWAPTWCNCKVPSLARGVGMPAYLKLEEFGRIVHAAFEGYPMLVGSALGKKRPRDVDVRLILGRDDWAKFVDSEWPQERTFGEAFTRWGAYALAFSALGCEMTGRPIDFQLQTTAVGNCYMGPNYILLGLEAE